MDNAEDDGFSLSFKKLVEDGSNLIANGCKDFLDSSIDENKMVILLLRQVLPALQRCNVVT